MPTPMTPRERVRTALRGEMADQIPFLSYSEMLPSGPARQRLHDLGVAAFDRIEPYRIRRNRVRVETRQIHDEPYPAVLTTYTTPIGTLTQKQIVGPGYGSLWTKEYLVKWPEDNAIFELDVDCSVITTPYEGNLHRVLHRPLWTRQHVARPTFLTHLMQLPALAQPLPEVGRACKCDFEQGDTLAAASGR